MGGDVNFVFLKAICFAALKRKDRSIERGQRRWMIAMGDFH